MNFFLYIFFHVVQVAFAKKKSTYDRRNESSIASSRFNSGTDEESLTEGNRTGIVRSIRENDDYGPG